MGTMATNEVVPPRKPIPFELLMLLLSPGNSPAPKVEEIKRICETEDQPISQTTSANTLSSTATNNTLPKPTGQASA